MGRAAAWGKGKLGYEGIEVEWVGVRGAGGENALLLEMRGFLSGTSVTPDDASVDLWRCTADDLVQRRIWLSTQAQCANPWYGFVCGRSDVSQGLVSQLCCSV